jgi:hypothetical protein
MVHWPNLWNERRILLTYVNAKDQLIIRFRQTYSFECDIYIRIMPVSTKARILSVKDMMDCRIEDT